MAKHVFGPVPSRRLGRSLGIDLTPTKTCSFDCRYCQLSSTHFKTTERQRFCAPEVVLAELREVLATGGQPDWITFSGTGEPTLHADLGALILGVRELSRAPVCVITNSSLVADENVRRDLRLAHHLLPTLATVDEQAFQAIHRPAPGLSVAAILDGLAALGDGFHGTMEIEVFLCAGINTSDAQAEALGGYLRTLPGLSSVFLNTVVRPPVDQGLVAVSRSDMQRFRDLLQLTVPVVTTHELTDRQRLHVAGRAVTPESIMQLLLRHPSTTADILLALEAAPLEVSRILAELEHDGRVCVRGSGFWTLTEEAQSVRPAESCTVCPAQS